MIYQIVIPRERDMSIRNACHTTVGTPAQTMPVDVSEKTVRCFVGLPRPEGLAMTL